MFLVRHKFYLLITAESIREKENEAKFKVMALKRKRILRLVNINQENYRRMTRNLRKTVPDVTAHDSK